MLFKGQNNAVSLFFKACVMLAVMCLLVSLMSLFWMLLLFCKLLRKSLQGVHDFALHSPRSAPSAGVVSCTYYHWFTVSGGVIASCLFLAGVCSVICSSGLLHISCLLCLTALQGNMLVGHTEYALIADLGRFLMSAILCLNAVQPLRQQSAFVFTPETDNMRSFSGQRDHIQVFEFILDCLDFLSI